MLKILPSLQRLFAVVIVVYVVYLEDVGLHLTNLCASLLTKPSEHDGCLVGK